MASRALWPLWILVVHSFTRSFVDKYGDVSTALTPQHVAKNDAAIRS
jgi:hypothetical protein